MAAVVTLMPFRSVAIGFVPSLYILYAIALVAGYASTGLLLGWWSRRTGDGQTIVLSATYGLCAILVAANVSLLLEPVRSAPLLQASLWMWLLWHLSLPLGIWLSAAPQSTIPRGRKSAALLTGGAAGVAAALLWAASQHLMIMTVTPRTTSPLFNVVGILAIAFSALALVRLLRREERRALDLLLALVVLSVVGDIVLIMMSPLGFSFGTYAARILGLLSGIIVVSTLLRWILAVAERSDTLTHYMTIAEATPTITFLTEKNGDCIYVNSRVTEFTGFSAEQASGKGFLGFIHPDDLPRTFDNQWYRSEDNHVRIRDSEGTYVWHLMRHGVVRSRSGEQIGWVGTATDVNRERQLVDELRRRYESEREISNAMQAAFLPRLLLPDIEGVQFTAVYRPLPSSNQVGGDWYDAFALPDGVLVFMIGDVSGHGLSAGASMLRLREGLRMAAFRERSPVRALELMNHLMMLESDISATAIVAFIDARRARMRVAVAGHPAPVLVRRGMARPMPIRGIVLGATEDASFDAYELLLEAGDEIAFYTDGLIEGDKRPIEGEARLFRALRDEGPDSLESLVDGLLSLGQADDATMVLVSYRITASAASWHFRSNDAQSARSARAAFRDHLLRNGAKPNAVARAELVFGELVGNVVRHAPGPIEIDLALIGGDLILTVRDRGAGFLRSENKLPDEPLAEAGRGLFLVQVYAGATPAIMPRRQGGTKIVATIVDAGDGLHLSRSEEPQLVAPNGFA